VICNNSRLIELPISLGDIPGITHLDAEGTSIPIAVLSSILASCRAKRNAGNVDTLPARLDLWKGYAKQVNGNEFDLTHILGLDDVHKNNISEWLLRLSRTSDFGSGVQKELAEKACTILAALKDFPEFKNFFLGQIDANNRACGDRAAQAFNELCVAYKIEAMDESASLKDKLVLLKGCAKTLLLRETIRKAIKAHEEARNAEVLEDVEIYLYYESTLRLELGLLTAIESMRYSGIGQRDWIDEENLKKTVRENHISFLCEMEVLKAIADKDPELSAAKEAVTNEFSDRLGALSEKELLEWEYKVQSDIIQTEQKQAMSAILEAWIEKGID
jgi:hypothetical protein